jgi:succinate dehydrogenase / fumarate reductase cytochrome b subunit
VSRYPWARNWAYVLQRASAVVVLVFIAVHVLQFRVPLLLGEIDQRDVFYELCASLSSTSAFGVPWVALGYLLGLAATVYHFANGLSGFCFSWGIASGRRGLRRVQALTGLLGVLLFAVGANSIIYFSTGSRFSFSAAGSPSATPALSCRDVVAPSDRRALEPAASLTKRSVAALATLYGP